MRPKPSNYMMSPGISQINFSDVRNSEFGTKFPIQLDAGCRIQQSAAERIRDDAYPQQRFFLAAIVKFDIDPGDLNSRKVIFRENRSLSLPWRNLPQSSRHPWLPRSRFACRNESSAPRRFQEPTRAELQPMISQILRRNSCAPAPCPAISTCRTRGLARWARSRQPLETPNARANEFSGPGPRFSGGPRGN